MTPAPFLNSARVKRLIVIAMELEIFHSTGIIADMWGGNSSCLGRQRGKKGSCTRDTPTDHYADFQRLDTSRHFADELNVTRLCEGNERGGRGTREAGSLLSSLLSTFHPVLIRYLD